MVARFDNQKNQKLLVDAFHLFPDLQKNFELKFIGDGQNYEEIKDYTNKLSLDNNIKFLGFRNNVGAYLRQSDAFILSTHYEGLPISIIEAMSYGLPIVATRVGGIPEMVTADNGFLFENTPASVHNSLNLLLVSLSKPNSLGSNSKKIFLEKFELNKELETINRSYIQINR